MTKRVSVPASLAGQRLDRVLELLLPGSGLRARRRLAESGRALLDGVACGPARKVRAGQLLELAPEPGEAAASWSGPEPEVLARGGGYAALRKPAGLHSAALAGGGGPSVEALLPELFPGEAPVLLNRLDRDTSGLLLVGLEPGSGERFRALEAAGAVDKEYRAVALGAPAAVTLRRRLDMAERSRTRVLDADDPDPARWTVVEPLEPFALPDDPGGATLLRVRIRRGARHQIRAHLAGAGHPLLGDALYGGPPAQRLFLHHLRLRFETGAGPFEAVDRNYW